MVKPVQPYPLKNLDGTWVSVEVYFNSDTNREMKQTNQQAIEHIKRTVWQKGYGLVNDDAVNLIANLIARECINQVNNAIPETNCSSSGAYKTARIAAITGIQNYFGIEE